MRGHEHKYKYHNWGSVAQLEKEENRGARHVAPSLGGVGHSGPASSNRSTTETSALSVRQLHKLSEHIKNHQLKSRTTAHKGVKCWNLSHIHFIS